MFRKLQIYILFIAVFTPCLLSSQTPLTTAPNFNAIDARGNYHDLYSYLNNGKYILLCFFYDTCFASQSTVPEINNAYIQFGCNTNEVLFMGINYNNTDGEVISFENQYALHYPNISGIEGNGNDIVTLFQVIAFPTIILIAPDKTIPKQDIWPLTTVNIVDELISAGVDTIACPYASVETHKPLSQFLINPNPAKDWININNLSGEKDLTISIFDYLGRNVYYSNNSLFSKEKINTSNYKSGIYFLQISKSGSLLFSEKIVIL